jgi:hypothetical protein
VIAPSSRRRILIAAALCIGFLPNVASALEAPGRLLPGGNPLIAEARAAEKKADWFRAAEIYGLLAKQHPDGSSFRPAQLRCLRHGRFARRLDDRSYQQFIEQSSAAESLQVLVEVFSRLQQTYVENRSVSLASLFHAGIEEINLALRSPAFSLRFLPARTTKRLTEFAAYLQTQLDNPPRKPAELVSAARAMADRAAELLGMRPEVFFLEFAAGACNGLDEYTTFLTPESDTTPKTDSTADTSVSEPRFLDMAAQVGYLRIHRFDAKTVASLDDGAARLTAAGMRVLILDLRGNGGGLLSAAVEVADRFVTSGVLVTTRGQIREYNRIFKARGNAKITVPLIVLIDGETASSAELVAAAFQDHQRGMLLGQRSFGKGTIQETVRLRGGVGVVITVARFLAPRGQAIDAAGVDPDIVVLGSSGDQEMGMDLQLQAALDLARTMGSIGP